MQQGVKIDVVVVVLFRWKSGLCLPLLNLTLCRRRDSKAHRLQIIPAATEMRCVRGKR